MSLMSYFIRRTLAMIPLTIGVSMLIFFMFAITPIDPVNIKVGLDPNAQKNRDQYVKAWGLDKPIYQRYLDWAIPMFTRLEFGESWTRDVPVEEIFAPYIGNTIFLFGISFVLSLLVSTIIGIVAATHHNSWFDQSALFGSLVGFSIPGFVLGIVLIMTMYSAFGILAVYLSGNDTNLGDQIWAVVVAELTMLISGIAFATRLVRSQMLNVLRQNYIRTARAKGLSERTVIYKHALRNALLPFVTVIALSLPGILSGSPIIERVFNYPGVGRQLIRAALEFDLPTVLAVNMFFSVVTIFMLLIADIVYGIVDPRIKF